MSLVVDREGEKWQVEDEDRSVGIFGISIFHESCPNYPSNSDEAREAVEIGTRRFPAMERNVDLVYDDYECPMCGTRTSFESTEPRD